MTLTEQRQVVVAPCSAPARIVGELLTAGMVVLLAQTVRPLFTLVYEAGEDTDYLLVAVAVAVAFALPLVLVAGANLARPVRVELVGAATGSLAFLSLSLVEPIPLWLGTLAAAAAIGSIVLVVTGLQMCLGWPHWLTVGLVVGLAADTALRALFRSWDLAWQDGDLAGAAALLLVAAVLSLAGAAGRTRARGVRRDTHRAGSLVVVGPYLMLQLLFVQNPAFVASQGRLSLPAAVAVVLGADLLVLLLMALTPPLSRRLVVPTALVGVVAAALLPGVEGAGVVVGVVAVHVAVTAALARALVVAPVVPVTLARSATGVVMAAEAFLVLTLLWQLDIVTPLPFPRAVLPALAAGAVAAPAFGISTWVDVRGALARPLLLGVALLAIVVPGGLWLDQPGASTVHASDQVRLVTYNVRGSVTTSGQLRPDLIAREIASTDPDVVLLQEVGRGMPVHGALDLLSFLADRLEMAALYEPAADGQLGNAVLSRLPMTELASGRLPHAGSQARSYLLAAVEVGDVDLTVLATHLERSEAQIDAVLEVLGDRRPAVLAGDLNVDPGDELLGAFDGLVDVVDATGDACRTTSAEPTSACDRPDWVFVTPGVGIDDVTIGTSHASDHLPIHVTLTP